MQRPLVTLAAPPPPLAAPPPPGGLAMANPPPAPPTGAPPRVAISTANPTPAPPTSAPPTGAPPTGAPPRVATDGPALPQPQDDTLVVNDGGQNPTDTIGDGDQLLDVASDNQWTDVHQ